MPSTTTSVLWRSSHLAGCEYATLTAHDGGASIEGTVLLPVRQRPSRITYRVDVDPAWRTRRCVAEIAQAGRSTQLVVEADARGRWVIGERAAPELDGCLDVDLEWTPATNTLPIRRAPEGGDAVAAWVRLPVDTIDHDLTFRVERLEQSYERIAARAWTYAAGSFRARLQVDDDGLVVDYGPGLWVASASGGSG